MPGFPVGQVRWVLNTRAHFDHSMADDLFRGKGTVLSKPVELTVLGTQLGQEAERA